MSSQERQGIRLLGLVVIGILFFAVCRVKAQTGKRFVCYYTNWSKWRAPPATFTIDDIDPSLCTHIIYSFAEISYDGSLVPIDGPSEYPEYDQFTKQQETHPGLKLMLAVGGWGRGYQFSLLASPPVREKFVNSAFELLNQHGFHGLDLDWEFPEEDERYLLTLLCQELRDKFRDEATPDNPRFLLSAAVSGDSRHSLTFDKALILQACDFVNIMAYDFRGDWDPIIGQHSNLYDGDGDDPLQSGARTIEQWIEECPECDLSKLNLGFAAYGRAFTDPYSGGIGSSAWAGLSAPFTGQPGYWGYFEICNQNGFTYDFDDVRKVPYAYGNNAYWPVEQWVGYDDIYSIQAKAAFIKDEGLGGAMVWAIDMDDFSGQFCDQGTWPLLKAMKTALAIETCDPVCHNGYCVDKECDCTDGWDGSQCLTAICDAACQNGGSCTDPNICSCAAGWTGDRCETEAPICESICQNGGTCISTDACSCSDGWKGSYCEIATCNPDCLNGGSCTSPNECECPSGWYGYWCETDSNHFRLDGMCGADYLSPIGGDGFCNVKELPCCSIYGWCGTEVDEHCTIPSVLYRDFRIVSCNPICQNGGTCTYNDICSCVVGWTGDRCQTASCYCQNGGTCTSSNMCNCAPGWTGVQCQTAICVQPCLNGDCTSPNTCTCDLDWTGSQCESLPFTYDEDEIPDETATCILPCMYGDCTSPNTCTCDPGWTGFQCETVVSSSCAPPCENGGTCTSSQTCNCLSEWIGTQCQIEHPCKTFIGLHADPTSTDCKRYFNCFNNTPAPQSCPGGTYFNPVQGNCYWLGSGPGCAEPEPYDEPSATCDPACQNGGTCGPLNICSCATGWTGPHCQTATCDPACQNGGTCDHLNVCSCATGWTGPQCQTVTCDPACQNGGTCGPLNTCSCATGWTGPQCQTVTCDQPCQNGGTCWSSSNTCSCVTGWSGTWCQTATCDPPCQNGGTCTSPDDICSCATGWSGATCQTVLGHPCLNQAGITAHPTDCTLYYNCWYDTPAPLVCGSGLYFNEVRGYCDWPVNVPECYP